MDLARQPFNNPSLQTHAMKGVTGEKRFISYVGGSKGRRLIWSRFNRAIVLLLYGEHDVVERKAERLVIELRRPDDAASPSARWPRTPLSPDRRAGQHGGAGPAVHGVDRR